MIAKPIYHLLIIASYQTFFSKMEPGLDTRYCIYDFKNGDFIFIVRDRGGKMGKQTHHRILLCFQRMPASNPADVHDNCPGQGAWDFRHTNKTPVLPSDRIGVLSSVLLSIILPVISLVSRKSHRFPRISLPIPPPEQQPRASGHEPRPSGCILPDRTH